MREIALTVNGERRELAVEPRELLVYVLRERGLDEEALARLRSPAGLDLGPSTQQETAVAVLAELVAWRHTRGDAVTKITEAVDPVCGMTVAVEGAKEVAVHDGVTYYFCGAHCRHRFEADPAQFVGIETAG